jgi:aminopeptidase-like protein
MNITDLRERFDAALTGEQLYGWVRDWYPINRSLTGDGVREQLRRLQAIAPLELREVPTGTPVFDWTVPKEWNCRDAYVKNSAGERVIDFQKHNLHVLGYSVPVHERMPLSALKEHCFTLPDRPELIPYRTSYYKEQWGFCVAQQVLDAQPEGEYEVCIDSTLEDGHLSYGEVYLPGQTEEEVFFSAHICHPSLANDNLSGIAIAIWLARNFANIERRYSYRFVFAPGTIGAITWLAQHEAQAESIRHGLILSLLGNDAPFVYKASRRGDAEVDRAARHVLRQCDADHELRDFSPYGYDERQYCSPGFNLPMGCFMRSGPSGYPEYHTSADNLDLVKPEKLAESLARVLEVIEVIERNGTYVNKNPKCEPQLGRRGLYGSVGGNIQGLELTLLWVLSFSDGDHSLLEIADKAGVPFADVRRAADALEKTGLL